MLVQQVLHPVDSQSLTFGAGKEHVLGAAWRLAQPGLQHGTGGFGQRRTAFLATLADDPQVSTASRDEVLSFEPGHFGQPKPRLHRREDEGVVASARPCASIRRRKQRVDFRAAQKTDQLARESLARDREHSLDLHRVGRQFERRVAKEGMDRGESQIAAPNAQAAAGLEVLQERGDQRCVDLLEGEPRGRPSETLVREDQELSEGVRRAGFTVSSGAKTGAVTLMQRFGSARNRNPHLHMLFLDGAYTFRGTKASFHRARRLQPDEWAKLLASLSRRIVRLLERRGLPIADPQHPVLEFDVGSALDQMQAASVKYGIAVGPHAGRTALTLYSVAPVDDSTGCGLLAQVAGFSLHAATVCEAHQRSKRERLCRYIPRPPIATKRLSLDRRGRVVYPYKRPCRDGSTPVVLEPLDFIARRAALVPRPRLNLTRFHGVFAPHCKHRARIVPHRPRGKVDNDQPTAR